MPDIELIGLILLLAVAVVFGYFYFKRAQARTTTDVVTRGTDAAPVESVTPVATERTTTAETVRSDDRPPT